jgi:acetyl esterase/lipase
LPYYAAAKDTPYVNVRTDTAHVYGVGAVGYPELDLKPLLVDAQTPTKLAGVRKAAVLFIHGGGFTSGGRKDMNFLAGTFTRMGLSTFTIDYRMTPDSPQVQPPRWGKNAMTMAMTAGNIDGKAALRWLHAKADSLELDTSNLFVFGCSAGSLIALADGVSPDTAYTRDSSTSVVRPQDNPGASQRIRAIVSWCGALLMPTDLAYVDSRDPPVFFYHGTLDSTVNYASMLQTKAKLDSAGVETELDTVPGAGHCPTQGAAEGTLAATSRGFVLRHIVAQGESGIRPVSTPRIRLAGDRVEVLGIGVRPEAVLFGLDGSRQGRVEFRADPGGGYTLPLESLAGAHRARLLRVEVGGEGRWFRIPPR